MKKQGYVYILTNTYNRVLYVGSTTDIVRRATEHKLGLVDGFTKRFNVNKLVYVEDCDDLPTAIWREGQLKRRPRSYKDRLITSRNPGWIDVGHEVG